MIVLGIDRLGAERLVPGSISQCAVLAVDPGARSGWALSAPALSGSVDHVRRAMEDWWGDKPERGMVTAWTRQLDKIERLKRTMGSYLSWLEGLIRYARPAVLIIETQLVFKGHAGTNCKEFRGVTLAAAGRLDLACVECAPGQWRKLLNGRAYDPAADHHIAAECMLAWWNGEART